MYRKFISGLRSRVKNFALATNYWLNNYNEVIWLIGNGRSGTTWVADLINHDKRFRQMFEPFHPQLVDGMGFLQPHQYIRPTDSNKELQTIAADVFSGKFRHSSIDLGNRSLTYKGLLIKDIFANLFARWASVNFPQIKIVLLMRNPFAVALSTHKKKDWFWVTDPLDLLHQTPLYADYLQPFEDIVREISASDDYISRQILIWAIINYVPLRQFQPGEIHICFYEDIYTDPNQEISNIFQFTKPEAGNRTLNIAKEAIARPSRVIGKESNLLSNTSPIGSWKNELTARQIDAGLNILHRFGLEDLYDNNSMPNRHVLDKIHGK